MITKNILHLTHTDLRNDNRILKELEALESLPNAQVFAFGFHSKEELANSNQKLKVSILNLKSFTRFLRFLPRSISYFFLFIELTIRFLFLSFKVKPSVVHCHDTMVLPAGVLIKLFFKCKLIYDAHELESNKNGQSKLLSIFTLALEKACWSKIDYLITVSDSILNWYNTKFITKPSTVILNSPIIKPDRSISKNYFHELYNIEKGTLIFVYLGLLSKGRCINEIIDAFSKPNLNSHVVFIGFGDLSNYINEIASKERKIHLHPSVPHEEVVPLVKNASIGLCLIENVSLSDYYCLPNKLFEYTFAGLPVLASNFPDIKNIVEMYKLGIICELNSNSINAAVREIELSSNLSINSDLFQLSWQYQTQKLLNIYSELMSF